MRRQADEPSGINEGGRQARDYKSVEDAASAFRLAMVKPNPDGHPYLVGSPFSSSLHKAADLVVAACGHGDVVERPNPPGVKEIEVSRYPPSFAKFRRATGWEPRVALREGIGRTVAFYRERLPSYT